MEVAGPGYNNRGDAATPLSADATVQAVAGLTRRHFVDLTKLSQLVGPEHGMIVGGAEGVSSPVLQVASQVRILHEVFGFFLRLFR